jgi:membrane-associated phospholipid phosphatase
LRTAGALLPLLLLATLAAPLPAQNEPDSGPLFGPRDLYFAGGFVAGTVLMFPLDRALASELQDSVRQASPLLHWSSNAVGDFGRTGPFLIGPAMYVVARLAGSDRFADLGLHGAQAIIVAEVANRAVKLLAGRARPYVVQDEDPTRFALFRGLRSPDYQSFVSGHAAVAFAAAAAVQQETEEWWPDYKWAVGTVMFGGASLVALSRMYDNKHWASDVVAGAAIGAFAGWKVVRWNHTSEPNNEMNRLLLGVSLTPGAGAASARLWVMPY